MSAAEAPTVPAPPAEPDGAPPRLEVRNLVVNYGSSRALSDVSFSVPAGQVIAVLGTNGAGKSTLAATVSGLVAPTSGRIVLDDSTELKGEPEAMTRAGARIFAERVARTVARGGVVTDYPDGEPPYVGPNPALTP